MEQVGIAVSCLIALLAAVLVLRHRLTGLIAVATWPLFLALAALALSTVWLPGPYQRAADWMTDQSGVADRLRELDKEFRWAELAAVSNRILERAEGILGRREGTQAPRFGPRPKLLEEQVLPQVSATVSTWLRGMVLVVALAFMLTLVSLNYAAAVDAERRRLEDRLSALERRLEDRRSAVSR